MQIFGEKKVLVRITFTNRCNASCTTCLTPHIRRPKADLSWPVFKRIIHEILALDDLHEVGFYSIGENYLHENFVEMVEWALPHLQKRGIRSSCVTNGVLITRVPEGIDEFFISFNAGRPDTYRRVTGLSYDRTTANIDRLYAGGEFKKAKDVQIHMLVFGENADEIDDVKRAFRHLRGVRLRLGYKFDNQHGELFDGSLSIRKPDRIPCDYVTQTLTFYATGDLILCPHDFEASVAFGRITDRPLEELLRHPARLTHLEQHLAGRFEGLCAHCNYNVAGENLYRWHDLHVADRCWKRLRLAAKAVLSSHVA